jgi:peptidoglycan/LPS O-acetylase OafA/YrhL
MNTPAPLPTDGPHPQRPASERLALSLDQLKLPKYRADIDGLRAIAILAVIGFHTLPTWVKGGFAGVDIFFTISGYLISSIVFSSLDRGSFSFIEFYSRRVKRIFPALIVVLMASAAVGWFELSPEEYKQLGKHIAGSAGFVQNYVLANEAGYFDKAAETKPLLHLWSLGIEEQFYIVWPPLLFFAWKRRTVLFALVVAIITISFVMNVGPVRNDVAGDFFSPFMRSWELLVGGILAYLTLYSQALFGKFSGGARVVRNQAFFSPVATQSRAILRNGASSVGFVLLLTAVFALNGERFFHSGLALLPALGTCMLIASGPKAWINRIVLSNRVFVWFGLISYPLYLWHWPLLSFTRIIGSTTPPIAIRGIAVLSAIVLAWLTYQFIERPIRFGKNSEAKVFALCVCMLVTGYAGYNIYRREGLVNRFPEVIQSLSNFNYDLKSEYRVRTCLLESNQDASAFGNCVDKPSAASSQSIVLWGDSFAAHLYQGLKREFGDEFKLTQLTAEGCAPLVGMGSPFTQIDSPFNIHCAAVNAYILDRIIREKPDRVILAANWREFENWRAVGETIRQLRKAGATRIDLVGPVPQWNDGLRHSLFNFYRQDVAHRRVPQRMTYGLVPGMDSLDNAMQAFATSVDINYISPMHILCNADGCLTRVGENADSLVAYDVGHLTKAGSVFLVSHFPR